MDMCEVLTQRHGGTEMHREERRRGLGCASHGVWGGVPATTRLCVPSCLCASVIKRHNTESRRHRGARRMFGENASVLKIEECL